MTTTSNPNKGGTPLIIFGMHRSGTSMITRLLHKCGLYLGEVQDLMLPDSEDNPEGYWEHQSLSNLNDDILSHLGGSWRDPPPLEPGWSKGESLQRFRDQFDSITAHFSSYRSWGWKDPRNSLTLEFWLAHLSDLKVLLCLRNPIEVADSLSTGKPMRDMERAAALDLWLVYHRAILQQDIGDRLIVTHYESYLYDPDAELRRILAALDIQASADQIEDALRTINPALKHQRMPDGVTWEESDPSEARRYYEALCMRAGAVFEKLRSDSAYLLNSTVAYAKMLRSDVSHLNDTIAQQNQKLAESDQRIEQQRQLLADHARVIDQQRGTLIEFQARLAGVQKLGFVALNGFKFRKLQRSRVMSVAAKLQNFWSIRRMTRAIQTGQLKISVLFDAQWYLEHYPDVSDAGMHPYVHFCLFGWYQGYRPMPLFDTHWYVTNYPHFNDDWANPLEHYEHTGQYVGCRPCEGFDPQWYRSQYADVINAGLDPLYHYYHFGLREGRQPSGAKLSQ